MQRDNLTESLVGNTIWQPGRAPSVACVLWNTAGLVGTPSLSRRGCGGTSPVRRLAQVVRSIDQNYCRPLMRYRQGFSRVMSRSSWWLLLGLLSRCGKSCRRNREQSSSGSLPVFVTQKEVLAVFMSRNHGMGTAAISEWDRPHRYRVVSPSPTWPGVNRDVRCQKGSSSGPRDSSQTWHRPLSAPSRADLTTWRPLPRPRRPRGGLQVHANRSERSRR